MAKSWNAEWESWRNLIEIPLLQYIRVSHFITCALEKDSSFLIPRHSSTSTSQHVIVKSTVVHIFTTTSYFPKKARKKPRECVIDRERVVCVRALRASLFRKYCGQRKRQTNINIHNERILTLIGSLASAKWFPLQIGVLGRASSLHNNKNKSMSVCLLLFGY